MLIPTQITFRNMEASDAAAAKIREEAAKLGEFYGRVTGCRVVVELRDQRRERGRRFHVRVELTVPGGEIIVNRAPSLHGALQRAEGERLTKKQEVLAPHKDLYVAVRDAFDAARRRLQDYAREQGGVVKTHEPSPSARVARLYPESGYGFLETREGREIYFHRNSVRNADFDRLEVGTVVNFVEEQGEKGPQAGAVKCAGK